VQFRSCASPGVVAWVNAVVGIGASVVLFIWLRPRNPILAAALVVLSPLSGPALVI
jgi:hypothetical protein